MIHEETSMRKSQREMNMGESGMTNLYRTKDER